VSRPRRRAERPRDSARGSVVSSVKLSPTILASFQLVCAACAPGTDKPPASAAPEWSVNKTVSPVDSTVNLSLMIASVSQSGSAPAYLMIECKDASPSLLVALHREGAGENEHEDVKYRIDSGAVVKEDWFFVAGANAIAPLSRPGQTSLLRKLTSAKRFVFEVVPMSESAVFDVNRLRDHADDLRKSCPSLMR
jgi:hypothetical protein